jgi:hypothetical protein
MEGTMRQGIAKVAAIGVLAAVPAVAFAGSTVYEDSNIDEKASIELKISDGANREVRKVTGRKLPFLSTTQNCTGTGRTDRIVVKGDWRVKGNGEFRVVGQYDGDGNPLDGGQLNVVGDVGANKVTGDVKFTYGKTGCTTEKLSFTAK